MALHWPEPLYVLVVNGLLARLCVEDNVASAETGGGGGSGTCEYVQVSLLQLQGRPNKVKSARLRVRCRGIDRAACQCEARNAPLRSAPRARAFAERASAALVARALGAGLERRRARDQVVQPPRCRPRG
eukprot:CAMPEP_0180071706 /NCGR_PEP_ID=MMETSP0985-20121206/12295_1 /TAXON_ID=483367 /ORGANISM="non described non described, Strain CCMP 2436" /LENGTH=129 /DNA_ID=CAMNT_0022002967 /DNA_START=229 /DNA_END=616 /DNA_ORIENTATION=-